MKSLKGLLTASLLLLSAELFAQALQLLNDNFTDPQPRYQDLSLLTRWGAANTQQTGLMTLRKADRNGLQLNCISITDSAIRYSGFTTINSLKTTTAVDWRLPTINRSQDTVIVQFDALWDTLWTNGENGRIVVAMMYGLGSQPFQYGLLDSVNLAAPFGRPAYNFRLLNKNPNTNRGGLYLFYGGGNSQLGEVEKFSGNGLSWWLPGFIAQPGGTQPGTGGPFPTGPCVTNFQALASNQRWQRITMVLEPELLTMYLVNTADSAAGYGQEIARMAIPKTDRGNAYVVNRMNAVHRTSISSPPLMYNWFPTIDGIRLYFRASQRAYVTNMKVFATQNTTSLETSNQAIQINPFPNPTTERFVVSPLLDGQPYALHNKLGQLVASGFCTQNGIITSHLPKGMYLIKIGSQNARVVVE